MKLVELLARELKAWPDGAEFYCQDYNRKAYPYEMTPKRHEYRAVLWGSDGQLSGVAAVVLSGIASDHDTAIVTRADWESERARIAKPARKADKDGWIRHRGGKQPLPDNVLAQVILRKESKKQFDDEPFIASDWIWSHHNCGDDVMYYREYKPAEQVEAEKVMRDCVEKCASTESASQLLYDPIAQGLLQWRDRITEIDATTKSLTTERAELVKKLSIEGFALIGRVVEPAEDMSDWRSWKVGDLVEFVKESSASFTKGKTYTIRGFRPLSSNQIDVACDDEGDENGWRSDYFKFHSRPSA